MKSATPTRSFEESLNSYIRARYPLLYLHTPEETRALDLIVGMSRRRGNLVYTWSRASGIRLLDAQGGGKSISDITDPLGVLRWYEGIPEKSLLVLLDYHAYFKEPTLVRKLRELGHQLKESPKNIIILSGVLTIPPELGKELTILDLPLPSTEEIRSVVGRAAEEFGIPISTNQNDLIVEAAKGLTSEELENVLAKSLVECGHLDKAMILQEKRQIVRKSGLVDYISTDREHAAEVGGLQLLKEWLSVRRRMMNPETRNAKLPLPKGILLVGIPGCGKSLTAMTVAREWELPLLRLDLGRVFSGLVGSSESNARSALAVCEAVSPCVLWIDEIEKGLSGIKSSGQSDGGTTSRVFGTLLTWMQEKTAPVFVVATANDISQLPPELLRKGRFDEIFFVDLPTQSEREDVLQIHLNRLETAVDPLALKQCAELTEGFSGSELEQAIVSALYLAFAENQVLTGRHLVQAISETVPLSQTMRDRIEGLRQWAKHRARPASLPIPIQENNGFRGRQRHLETADTRAASMTTETL